MENSICVNIIIFKGKKAHMDGPIHIKKNITDSAEYHYEWSVKRDMLYLINENEEILVVFPLTGCCCYFIKMKE